MAAMERESIPVTRSVSIPRSEVEFRFSRSSGPGGQHAQRTETRVEVLFDVDASSALSDAQKRRVVARAGPVIRAIARERRLEQKRRRSETKRLRRPPAP
jgi:ribosome-associated protein